jgi:calcium-translocating P-type ATPase
MAQPLAPSSFVTGEPITLGPEVSGVEDLVTRLGCPSPARIGCLSAAPGIVLVHSLTVEAQHIALRWVNLPHAPRLAPSVEPAVAAVVLTGPIAESERAIRVACRLVDCLRRPDVLDRARAATTREALVNALAPAERTDGESRLESADLLALLGTRAWGLDPDEASRRLAACGPNRLERVRRRSALVQLLGQFWSFFAVLLWVAGGFALLAGMPQLGWAIFAVIVVNGVFAFVQEYRAERAVEALEKMLPAEITALRAGIETRLLTEELVPGDVVLLAEGDQVPADLQLLSAAGLRVDQSALTGESHPVFKLPPADDRWTDVPRPERSELVFAGTAVVSGSATAVVRATGMHTEIGGIARLTQAVVKDPSPLEREMARVTRVVTAIAVSVGAAFFALGVLAGALSPGEGFLFALGVIVANVPEGLLPTLTLALALGAQRMARQGSLVKRLSSVETLGAATVICTDKTGTVTEGRMAMRFAWVGGRVHGAAQLAAGCPADARELFEAAVLASQASVERGDPTEVALVVAGAALGVDADKVRRAHDLLAPHPFDSFRKRMTLVRATGAGPTAYVKGAPRETLALCETIRWGGRTVALGDDLRRAVLADHDRLAADGLRLLAIAVRPLADELVPAAASMVERDLTLLGLVALWDPPRPEVKNAVAQCRGAGIRIIMVTGDDGLTARAIAGQIGLPVEKVVTGRELERLHQDALRRLLGEPGVLFARTSPDHKLAIIRALRAMGEVVAVTGDGVNDAPALKVADIGVAMGRRGTDVAKEASVLVIADDNFASVVTAVRAGRAIYANMGKFVTYIFASNVPELVPFLAFVFLGIPLPLTIMQILAVDLGTDLVPALALGAEPPEADVMDRPPRARDSRLLDRPRLLRAYGFLGLAEAALALGAFFWTYWRAGWRPGLPMAAAGPLYRRATTMTFSAIVAAQVGNVLACRTDRDSILCAGLFSNRYVFTGIAAEIGLLLALIFVPPLPEIFGLAPLAFPEWGILLGMPPAMLLLDEGRKWVARRTARPQERP